MNPVDIKIRCQAGDPATRGAYKALLLPLFQGAWGRSKIHGLVDKWSEIKPRDMVKSQEIRGDFKEFTILHLKKGLPFERVLLIGSGSQKEFSKDRVRSIAAKAARTLRKIRCTEMVIIPDCFPGLEPAQLAQAVVEGMILGLYRFSKYTPDKVRAEVTPSVLFLTEDSAALPALKAGVRRGESVAHAANRVRDLANTPGNLMTPRILAETARGLSKHPSVKVTVHDEKVLKKKGMGGILSVAQGSDEPARLVVLEYGKARKSVPHIAFVGKGVTFDTGGISIKPAAAMHHMKYDMSGAAAVIGIVDAIARLDLPVRITGVIPSAENMPSARAYKPGDVIKTYSGKYVEIMNTDAEGRMLLADALTLATESKPDLIVDLATLTGGCVIALGHIASGVMGNCDWLCDRIQQAGNQCQEKMWQLPLYSEYMVQIRSTVADVINSGGRPASAITAGMFLKQFVGDIPWAHIDIAGTAWIEEDTTLYIHKPYLPKRGATGVGVRSMVTLVEDLLAVSGGSGEKLRKQLKVQ